MGAVPKFHGSPSLLLTLLIFILLGKETRFITFFPIFLYRLHFKRKCWLTGPRWAQNNFFLLAANAGLLRLLSLDLDLELIIPSRLNMRIGGLPDTQDYFTTSRHHLLPRRYLRWQLKFGPSDVWSEPTPDTWLITLFSRLADIWRYK